MRILAALLAVSIFGGQAPAHAFDWLGKVEIAAEGLQSKDVAKRLTAVERLGQYDVRWTKRYLLLALTDVEPSVRIASARILGRARVKEAQTVVSQWLAGTLAEEKKVAAEVLGLIGDTRSVPALVRSLGDLDHEVRLRAVVALGQIGSPQVIVPIIARLEDNKPEVRRAAVAQLIGLGDARAVVPLVGAFADSSMQVRVAAIQAVGRLRGSAAVPALVRLLSDPMENIRLASVTALGNLGAAESAPALIAILGAGSNEFRSKVAFALGQIAHEAGPDRGAAAVRALVAHLDNSRVRAAAREALLAAGPAAVPALIHHLEGRLGGDAATTVELLRDLGDSRATPALVAELARTRLSRELVLDALRTVGDRRALVPILSLLADGDPEVRVAAMRALERAIEPGGRGSDVLAKSLDDQSERVRAFAARYLGRMRANASVDTLVAKAQDDPSLSVRRAAVTALGAIGDPRASRALVRTLDGGPKDLHEASANALAYLADPNTLPPLLSLAKRRSHPSRPLVLRAVAALLRGPVDKEDAIDALEPIAEGGSLAVSVAAIGALGATGDEDAEDSLKRLARSSSIHRRGAALTALGNLPIDARRALTRGLSSEDDRIAGAAAWSLAHTRSNEVATALLYTTQRDSFAVSVNASAALALAGRKRLAKKMLPLFVHSDRFIRANAAFFFRRHQAKAARKPLVRLLTKDSSWWVRQNAARALSRYKDARGALVSAQKTERHPRVLEALDAALSRPVASIPRDDWQTFAVHDPVVRRRKIRDEPYFLAAADGLVTAHYTNESGEVTEEHFPAGPYRFEPRDRARDF